MAYTINPNLPRVRGQAVELVRRGWKVRKVARHFGFSHSAVVKWCAKARQRGYGAIPTLSSRPKHHPGALTRAVVAEIIQERVGRRRCAEHVYHALKNREVMVSVFGEENARSLRLATETQSLEAAARLHRATATDLRWRSAASRYRAHHRPEW